MRPRWTASSARRRPMPRAASSNRSLETGPPGSGRGAAGLLALAEPEGCQAALDDAHLSLEILGAQAADPVPDLPEGWGPEHTCDDCAVLEPDVPGSGPDPEHGDVAVGEGCDLGGDHLFAPGGLG